MRKAHLGFPEGPHPQAGAPTGSLRRRDPLAVDGRPPSTTGRCSGLTASLASRLLLPNAAGARASRGACGKCLRRVGNSWAANGWDRAQNLHALGAFPAALTGPREVPHGLWGAEPARGRRPSSQDAGLGECHSELCVSARRAWLRPPFLTRSFQCLYGYLLFPLMLPFEKRVWRLYGSRTNWGRLLTSVPQEAVSRAR